MVREIWKRIIDPDCTFIIAEAGVNHNGDMATAKELVKVAASAGANAVKFQTFKAENLVTTSAPKADYQLKYSDPTESQYEMLKRLELSTDAHYELFKYCAEKNILFMSTPFDEESADYLTDLGLEIFKIPSGEITNLPFLAHVAEKGRPMIVSTGMASLGEVETALNSIHATGNTNTVLLHCVSSYPAMLDEVNLRAMKTMAEAFRIPIGYSDHTEGIDISLAAVALGACVIEKHFTLDRNMEGPDHQASLEPDDLHNLVRGIRAVEAALGNGRKKPTDNEADTAAVVRKSLVASRHITAGSELTRDLISIKRPGTGLPPSMLPLLIGRTMDQEVNAGTLFTMEMIR